MKHGFGFHITNQLSAADVLSAVISLIPNGDGTFDISLPSSVIQNDMTQFDQGFDEGFGPDPIPSTIDVTVTVQGEMTGDTVTLNLNDDETAYEGSYDGVDGSIYIVSHALFNDVSVVNDITALIQNIPDQTIAYEGAFLLDASLYATGSNLVYSLTQAPSYLSIDSDTGLISGTAPSVDSTDNLTVRVTNDLSSDEDTFESVVVETLDGPFISPIRASNVNTGISTKSKEVFAFDRFVGTYTGNAVRLKRVSDDVEENFGFASDGRFDIESVETWRGSSDVDIIRFFSQYITGKTLFAHDGRVQFIIDGETSYHRMGFDYIETIGTNGFYGNNVPNGKGAFCANLTGDGVLLSDALTFDAGNGLNLFTLFSSTTTKSTETLSENVTDVSVTTTDGSTTVTVADTTNIDAGMWVHGGTPNIQEWSRVETVVNGTTLELTQTCRATGSITVDFLEFNHDFSVEDEYVATYGINSANRIEIEMAGFSQGSTITRAGYNGSGEININSTRPIKAYAPQVFRLRMGDSDYENYIHSHVSDGQENFDPAPSNVDLGDISNGRILIGGRMSNSSDPTIIDNNGRGVIKFGGVVLTEDLTDAEAFELYSWLKHTASNHRTLSDADNLACYDDLLLFKDAVENPDGTGELESVNGNVTLNFDDSAGFEYGFNRDGVVGVNVETADNTALWRANNTYGLDDGEGGWIGIYHNNVTGGNLSAMFGMTDRFAENDASLSVFSFMIGQNHEGAVVMTATPPDLDADNVLGNYFVSDGAVASVLDINPDWLFQYPYRIVNADVIYGDEVDYGGDRGIVKWNKDTISNTEPNQPANTLVTYPILETPVPENIGLGKKASFCMTMGVYKAPDEFARANGYTANKPYLMNSDVYNYSSISTAFAGEFGSIARKEGWGTTVYHEDGARLCNSNNSRDFEGTYLMIGRLADGRGLTHEDRMIIGANAFRFLI